MKRLLFTCLMTGLALIVSAQVKISGYVTDSQSGKPLGKVIVSARDQENKMKGFTQTKTDGAYTLTVAGEYLHFSIIGYKKKTINLTAGRTIYDVALEQSVIELKEVKVKARKIRQRGDTLIYHVATFAKDGDRSIGDVLKKMPGIQVANDGKISYNGMPINKFYIEGKDLLQGKYGLATKGVEHQDVSSVEVMTNHQPIKALKSLSESEQAAINLRLKDGSKSHLITTIQAAIGLPSLWNSNLTTMMFSKQWQMISTYKTNNTGEDLLNDIREHASFLEPPRQEFHETDYLSLPVDRLSELKQNRTLFNKSHLLSTNWIFGIGQDATLDAQVSYLSDRQHADHQTNSVYFLAEGSRLIEDRLHSKNGLQELSVKLTAEVNRDSNYLNNILRAELDWHDGDVQTTGTYNTSQHLYQPHHQLSNTLEFIHRKGKNALTLNSHHQMDWLPQYTSVMSGVQPYRQELNRRSFYSDQHVNYDLGMGMFVVAMEGGMNYINRRLNNYHTYRYQTYLTPTLRYPHRDFNFTFRLPLNYYHYDFDGSKRDDVSYGTSLGVSYRGIPHLSLSLTGDISENPYNISSHYDGLLMTNYRTMTRGTTEYGTATGKSLTLSTFYQNTTNGIFGFLTVSHMWNKNPFVSIQSFDGNWLINGLMLSPNHSRSWLVNGNIETLFPLVGGMFKLYARWLQFDREMMTDDALTAYRNNSLSLDAIVNGTLFRKLNWKYELEYSSSHLCVDDGGATTLRDFEHSFSLYYSPIRKLSFSLIGEYYHNEIATRQYSDYFLMDSKAILKFRSNLELALTLNNIFNVNHYSHTIYNEMMSISESQPIRGRELLLSIYFRP